VLAFAAHTTFQPCTNTMEQTDHQRRSIFCGSVGQWRSVEHVIPKTLGGNCTTPNVVLHVTTSFCFRSGWPNGSGSAPKISIRLSPPLRLRSMPLLSNALRTTKESISSVLISAFAHRYPALFSACIGPPHGSLVSFRDTLLFQPTA
jgi:hypothetical protein